LLTTQYLEEADQLADQIAIIDKGTIVANGTPRQLKAKIGKKLLSIRLRKQPDLEPLIDLLDDRHGLQIYQTKDPLVFQIPVEEVTRANQAIHSLLENDFFIENFSLSEPSLDDVFLTLTDPKKMEVVQ
jgi:ABC-2 type transport system ATP-binding protein